MASEWQELSLKEAGVELIDCDHRTPPAAETGFPYIAIPQLKDGRVDLSGVRRISADHFADWTRKLKPRTNDVIVVRRCNSGESAVVPEGLDCAIGQNLVVLRSRPGAQISPRYLRWLVRGPEWWSEVSTYLNVGAVFDSLKCRDIPNFRVRIPSLVEQEAIAQLLGSIDDRIDNLRKTNATLESIAQTLFKSWFVDFDPVRAKAEGREPEGMDAVTAALFPSEFQDSELGPIPKGWRTESFEQEFDFTMGQSPPGSTYNQDGVGVPFFQGSTDFGDVFPVERVFCTEPTRFARAGDLLMSVRAPVGALNVASIECSIGRGLCAIRHKSGSTGFTQQSIRACLARIENAAGEGALFKSLSKKQLADLPVVAADSLVVDAMISLLEPLAARQIVGARQAQRLAQLRDTVLPRLISGKLRLPEAEREIEAATA